MEYYNKLVVIECTKCGQNRKVTDRYAKFVEDNNVEFVCDVCKGVKSTFMMENVPPIVKAKLPDGRGLIDTFKEMTSSMDWELYYELQELYPVDMVEQACEVSGRQCTLTL